MKSPIYKLVSIFQDEYIERDYEFAGLQRFGRASLVALAAASLCYSAPDPALALQVCLQLKKFLLVRLDG